MLKKLTRSTYFPAFSLLVLSALLLTVIQAPIGWSFLAWGALVPFVLACSPGLRPRTLALMACAVGYVYWLVNLYWILPITVIGWLALCLYLSLFWVLPALMVHWCRAKGLPMFLVLPVLIAGAERLQGFPMGGFFWRFLGHSQYENLALIQVADLVGAAGVSFVVAMVNGLLADLVLFGGYSWHSSRADQDVGSAAAGRQACPLYSPDKPSVGVVVLGTAMTLAVAAGTVLYGHWRLGQTPQYVTEGPLTASLQSNVPQSIKRSFSVSTKLFNNLMDKSRAAVASGAELIIWPETMVQGLLDPALWPYLTGDLDEDKVFHWALSEHAKGNAFLLVGAYGAEILTDGRGERYLGSYNSAYFYRPDGTQDPGRYDKIHLVLFGEYVPFKKTFPWLFEQLKRFLPDGYNPGYSLEHGKEYTIFDMNTPAASDPNASTGGSVKAEGLGDGAKSDGEDHPQAALDAATRRNSHSAGRFAVIICYEDTIPYVARNFTLDEQGRKRIDWLVNISNDGWFVRFPRERVIPSSELPQHAAICVFRAVENRLAVMRSVNTGISCLIESTGRIRDGYLAASNEFPRAAMDRTALTGWFLDRLPIDKRVTLYSRYGEWFANGCAVAFAAVLVWPLGLRLVRRRT